MATDAWEVIDLAEVRAKLKGKPVEYLEFLNVPSMSCGLFSLAAGSKDMQAPHDEDEVYFVLTGRARLRLGDEDREVRPGTLLYIRAATEHFFFEIEEDMTLLVLFATGSRG
ncbi:MAG: cupin domain-containing protein [Gammaproteobacteria bacterium]|nr:cupin domain-containing protein [Gammaproteobacteria bacterium]